VRGPLADSLDLADVDRVRPLRAFTHFELNGVPISNLPLDLRFVNEEVIPLILLYEAESLCVIEPFYCASYHYSDVQCHRYFK